jgi:hypothetical protein
VTRHPTAEWLARQITEAFPWTSAPAYLVRDNDAAYGHVFTRALLRRRARKRWKSSKARRSLNLNVVVMTFAARHRRKSDKYSSGVPRSQSQLQIHQGSKLTSEKRG